MTCTTVNLKAAKRNEEYYQSKFDAALAAFEKAKADLAVAKKATKKAQKEYNNVWGD